MSETKGTAANVADAVGLLAAILEELKALRLEVARIADAVSDTPPPEGEGDE